MSTDIVAIPFHGQTIQSVEVDGKPCVVFRPLVESLDLVYSRQLQKLESHSWATVYKKYTVGADGKNREMACVPVRTLMMWLATINESKVKEAARPLVVAYQDEVADVIEAYWTKGGVINPRATEGQLTKLRDQIEWEAKLCQMMKGVIHPDHLDAKGRIILARGMGEAPQLEEKTRPIYVSDFLEEKGLTGKERRKVASTFGKRLKGAYVLEHGEDPGKYPQSLKNGQVRDVYAYTEADRPLMEAVWNKHYAA